MDQTVKPTPTPWRAIHQYIFSGDHAIPIASGHKEYVTCTNGELYAKAQANAAYIVKAVNSHDAMRDCLEWINRKGGMGLDVHERIRDVLASIKDRS